MFNKNFSKDPTDKQKIGQLGEDCACKYLESKNYRVIERNYLKKWGEIDIVCRKGSKLHFVEVKAVSRSLVEDVTHETSISLVSIILNAVQGRWGNNQGDVRKYNEDSIFLSNQHKTLEDDYRPEDNMHPWKLQRLGRAVQSYLLDRNIPDDVDWQFDVVTVYLDTTKGRSRVELLEDIVL